MYTSKGHQAALPAQEGVQMLCTPSLAHNHTRMTGVHMGICALAGTGAQASSFLQQVSQQRLHHAVTAYRRPTA